MAEQNDIDARNERLMAEGDRLRQQLPAFAAPKLTGMFVAPLSASQAQVAAEGEAAAKGAIEQMLRDKARAGRL